MEIKVKKIGKSKYFFRAPDDLELIIWKDSYTDLWRAKEPDSPVDYFPCQMTRKEIFWKIENHYAE